MEKQIEKKIDNAIGKVEAMFTNWLKEFEKKPVNTGLKILVILYVVKKGYAWFKK